MKSVRSINNENIVQKSLDTLIARYKISNKRLKNILNVLSLLRIKKG